MTTDLEQKIIAENDQIFESVTPKYTTDWYIKWVASVAILISIAFRAADGYEMWDLGFGTLGVIGWLLVSIMWKDRALILLNGVSLMMLVIGIFNSVYRCIC
jgi:fatty-acid desaturase